MQALSLFSASRSMLPLFSSFRACSTVRFTKGYISKGERHFRLGKEYVAKNQPNFAIREFNRANTAFAESSIDNERRAETLMQLGDLCWQTADRKILSAGIQINRRGIHHSSGFTKARKHFLNALNILPPGELFNGARAQCWQRAASLHIKCNVKLKDSMLLLKEGINQMKESQDTSLWESYFHTLNILIAHEVEENPPYSFYADRISLSELVHQQIDILLDFGNEDQVQQFIEVFLNAMRITTNYWGPQGVSKYWALVQTISVGLPKHMATGHLIVAENMYDTVSKMKFGTWYNENRKSNWNPFDIPESTPTLGNMDLSDLGKSNASTAFTIANENELLVERFIASHLLGKIFVTQKDAEHVIMPLLERCMDIAKEFQTGVALGVAHILMAQWHISRTDFARALALLNLAQSHITSDSSSTVKSYLELYYTYILLYKRSGYVVGVNKSYEIAIQLVKDDNTLPDEDWQILLGYAVWQAEQKQYKAALANVWECIEQLKQVLHNSSILQTDEEGPWKCIFLLLREMTIQDPERKDLMKRFQDEVDALETYFPKALQQITECEGQPDLLATSEKYCFPNLLVISDYQTN